MGFVTLYGLVVVLQSLVLVGKGRLMVMADEEMRTFLVALAVISSGIRTGIGFALMAGGVVVLGALFSQSGRALRLAEFTGLAYVSQIPWAVVTLVLLIWYVEIPTPPLPNAVTVEETRQMVESDVDPGGLLSTIDLVQAYSWLWFVALQASALRVVSGFRVFGAWSAGLTLALVFVVVPWVVQRYGVAWEW